MKHILFIVLLIATSLEARDAIDLLQNKRVSISYGLVLLNQPKDSNVNSKLQVKSLAIASYSRKSSWYLSLVIDSYDSITVGDTYAQSDLTTGAGYSFGNLFSVNARGGLSSKLSGTTSTNDMLISTNIEMYFSDISVTTLKISYAMADSPTTNISLLLGITF